MEELNTNETQPTEETPAPESGGSHEPADQKQVTPKELREYADRVAAENTQLRTRLMRSELAEIGLNPEEGLGVAIAESYKGDIDREAIATYAAEKYKYTFGSGQTPEEQSTQRMENLANSSQSVTPQTPPDEFVEKTQKMNDPEAGRAEAEQSLLAKVNQFNQEHYGPRN